MAGLYFEQFSVGQTFVHEIRRTVTDMDNILFSALTYNPAAVHIDHEYAKSTEFGKPLMNSIFTLGLIIGLRCRIPPWERRSEISGWRTPNFHARSLPVIRSGPRRKFWPCARASHARPRASSRSSIAASISTMRKSPIAAAPG